MFGPTVPEHSIILLLGLVFSVIAPLVLVSALIFFCMALLVESYNWVSGSCMWYPLWIQRCTVSNECVVVFTRFRHSNACLIN